MSRRNSRNMKTSVVASDPNASGFTLPYFRPTVVENDATDGSPCFLPFVAMPTRYFPQGKSIASDNLYGSYGADTRSFEYLTTVAVQQIAASLVNKVYYDPTITGSAVVAYFESISRLLGYEKLIRDVIAMSENELNMGFPSALNFTSRFRNGAVINTWRSLRQFLSQARYPKQWANVHEEYYGLTLTNSMVASGIRWHVNVSEDIWNVLPDPSTLIASIRDTMAEIANSATSRRLLNVFDFDTISLPEKSELKFDQRRLQTFANMPCAVTSVLTSYTNPSVAVNELQTYFAIVPPNPYDTLAIQAGTDIDHIYRGPIRRKLGSTVAAIFAVLDNGDTSSLTGDQNAVAAGTIWNAESPAQIWVDSKYAAFDTSHLQASQAAFELLYKGLTV